MNTDQTYTGMREETLLQHFDDLCRYDRSNTAQLLATIAEIDHRKVWARHAYPSMFAFCMERYHMSESVTAKRIWAARTARRFPAVLPMVANGELHLSGVNQLAKLLTEANHQELLNRAKHKSTREIELLVAELAPRPDVPSRIRALPLPKAGQGVSPACEPEPRDTAKHETSRAALPRVAERKPVPPRQQISALAPRRYKLEITVDQPTYDTLRTLQDLMGHTAPAADPSQIVGRALELLLVETLKRKAAITGNPQPRRESGETRTRAIPAAVRRKVWRRDRGRCNYIDGSGRRCRATRAIEYHHVLPYGKGGGHDAENIALRCRAHNQFQADLDFGRAFMDSKRHDKAQHSARNVGAP